MGSGADDRTFDPDSGPAGSDPPDATPVEGGATWRAGGPPDDARYLRDGLLGKGGMGVVYLARDQRLDRPVALKEAARGGEVAARLAREARVTAGLDHPGIVTVHDSGVTPDGRPFYTMRLLRGRPLSTVLAERSGLSDRLGLVRHYLDACNALAYAHAEGVVHRDVKPANIMIGGFGETQVVDWGLAAVLGDGACTSVGPEPDGDATHTRTGAVLGTPAYMSPEQARGEPTDPRSDVWSLGAVLYELLSGERPRLGGTSDEVLARARGGEVPDARALAEAPAELVAVAERALARDPADRYPDAGALAADVGAWLDGRPVDAHRYTPWELLARLVRAWRGPLAVGAAALVVVAAIVAGGTWRLARERDRVEAAERDARAALATSDANLAQALVAEAVAAMGEGSTAVAAVLASRAVALADAPEAWGVLAGVASAPRAERVDVTAAPACAHLLLVGPGDVVCVNAHAVARIVGNETRWTWPGDALAVRLDPDRVFVQGGPDTVEAIDLSTGAVAGRWHPFGIAGGLWPIHLADWGEADVPGALNRLAARLCEGFTYAGAAPSLWRARYAVVCADGRVGEARIGELPARWLPTPASRQAFNGVVGVERTSDGRTLVLGGSKGDLAVVDLVSGATHTGATFGRDPAGRLALSADGRRVAVPGARDEVEVRTLPDLELLARVPAVDAGDARFLPDGTLLVASGNVVTRWRLPSGAAPAVLRGPDGLTGVTFSPDGTRLATSHGRLEGRVWDLASGRLLASLPIGEGTAKAAAFTPDGAETWFATVGLGGVGWRPEPLRLDGAPAERVPDALLLPPLDSTRAFATRRIVVLRTGALVAPGYGAGQLFSLDTSTRLPLTPAGCPDRVWVDAAQSPAGEHGVLVADDGAVVLLDPGPPLRCGVSLAVAGAGAADVDAAGAVVVGTDDGIVRLAASGAERWRAPYPGHVLDVAVSADGRWIAAGAADHTARVWDAEGRLRAVLVGHDERVASVDFRPDGRVLATGSWDGTARLWNMGVLDAPAVALDAGASARWGLTLQDALRAAGR